MILDTYAWIEFFNGSKQGKKIEEFLKRKACYTSIVSLAEITQWCLKNNHSPAEYNHDVINNSTIIDLNKFIAELAGKINFESKKKIKNWGMLDSLILATGRMYNLKIVTGDEHFKELDNVIFLR